MTGEGQGRRVHECGGAGRLIKVGKQPIDLKGQVFWNAEKPHGKSDLVFQFQVKFLFPK